MIINIEDLELKNYVSNVTDYLLTNYCKNIDVSSVQNINLIEQKKMPNNVDFQSEGDDIFISDKAVYSAMMVDSINDDIDLKKCQYELKFLLHGIFHELCHADAKSKMPNLHDILFNDKNIIMEKLVAHLWIEFLVESKSAMTFSKCPDSFCKSFVTTGWNIQYCQGNREDSNDLYWFLYAVPYFLSLCYVNDCMDKFINTVTDNRINSVVRRLMDSCLKLLLQSPFDNYERLKILEDIIEAEFQTDSKNYEILYL